MPRYPAHGFTLIEVMITVAIVAILAAVALPAYDQYVMRSRLPAGLDALGSVATRMEQRFQDTGNYANGANCGVALPEVGNFTLSCAVANAGQTYVATATGKDRLLGYAYSINERGERHTVAHKNGGALANCWTLRGKTCDS